VIRRQWFAVTLAAGGAAVLGALMYWPTLGYGFYYDDYHFVRPYSAHEVLAAFRGPWDASGIETPYYRPLTICLYAARFALFGLNAPAYHALSLLLFLIAAALFAVFAMRASGTWMAGVIGAAVFIVHPGMPYSAVAWVTNQMHLAELIVVLTALVWWVEVRRAAAVWWMPLLVLQTAALLLKEDGVMLIPAVILLHTLRKYIAERDLPHVPIAFIAAAAVLIAGILAIRASALQGVPPHRLPSFDQALTNWTRALDGAFRLQPARRPFQVEASWFVTMLPLIAFISWRRMTPGVRFTLTAGLSLGVLFTLPFAFIVKAEQLHLVAAGGALLLTGAAAGVLQALSTAGSEDPAHKRRALAAAGAVAIAAGLAAMAAVARDITRDFQPFGPIVLHTDAIVQEWAAVPAELREYLAAKTQPGAAARLDPNPAAALTTVAFGLHGRETSPDGVPLRWMAGPVSHIFVTSGIRLVTIPFRHEMGAFQEAAHVRVEADGRVISDQVVSDGRWRQVDVSLRQRESIGVSGMHRIRVRLDHAWIPANVIPGSGDRRTLGLQIGVIGVR
jgi:hypothetical protein